MVAVQPKLEWPEGVKLNSEIVVIVDRSASMAGKRIAQVRINHSAPDLTPSC
jgi:hypothetical protein